MSSRNKRKLENFDPTASDPEDLDYGAPSPPRPQRRVHRSSKSANRPRKKQRYGDSEDEIEDDDDDSLEEGSFGASDSEEEEAEINPRTGRASRKATKKEVKYEESSEGDEDIQDTVESDEDGDELATSPRKTSHKESLTVVLKVPKLGQVVGMRPRRESRAIRSSSEAAPAARGTRRSSRISHEAEEPLVQLTNSGNMEVARPGTRSPDPVRQRETRGGKGVKKMPSAIMEASQETSSKEALATQEEGVTGGDEPEEEGGEVEVGATSDVEEQGDVTMGEGIIMESDHDEEEVAAEEQEDDEDDDDDGPVTNRRRSLRTKAQVEETRSTRSSQRKRKGIDESSDFDPAGEEEVEKEDEDMSESDAKRKDDTDDSGAGRRSRRIAKNRGDSQRRRRTDDSEQDSGLDRDELAEEAAELAEDRSRRRTRRAREIVYEEQSKVGLRNRSNKPDYRLYRPELLQEIERHEDEVAATHTPQRNRRGGGGGGAYRSLFSMAGPFGGAGGGPALFGGPEAAGAAGGADSDSSDDDQPTMRRRPTAVGGAIGMTPTSAAAPNLFPQTLNADPLQGGVGKVKDKKALADADPLGVDQNVTFEGVGGLEDHINQLKEMVALPLLYPEVFLRFHVTPPRGVLFHGPPGTGKTLLARALASSVSSHGKRVTFYMRKGADALSKWVGEAERQLRLLFEEARKNQPSIIFFDEIDGLAPVRSSKQEQIHASIVATLLALMDGMDGRGQVIVIGATNRPDNVDPALRRPGRFDREFYFPLPDIKARRAILDIHTKGWDPPLKPEFKDQLATLTKGYGGADLRALCTEAALNAVQGTFPQIYSSDKKLVIEPSKINVLAKDFMISVNKMIPSSERSAASGSASLPKAIEPLLRRQLEQIMRIIDETIPRKRKLTALEEAQFDDRDDSYGFERETLQQEFEKSRIYRPRLLIHGTQGMGQQHLGSALLAKLETLHVQSFDLPSMFEDSSTSPEATLVRLFKEVRRHKPSVIYIPNVDIWYDTVGPSVIKTFTGLLRGLPSNEPVILIGVMETEKPLKEIQQNLEDWAYYAPMMQNLFSYTQKSQYQIARPDAPSRRDYFQTITSYIRKRPVEFPDLENRKKRRIDELPVAEEAKTSTTPTKEELKRQKKNDRLTLNMLKIHIQPIMDQIRTKHKKFRTPVVDDAILGYLYEEQDPAMLSTDLTEEQRAAQALYRPFELATDKHGVQGLKETITGKFYYNLDTVMIEKRLSNGYYKRPKDFLADIKRIAKDARTSGDADRTIKANEMLANVEVDIQTLLETGQPALVAECEAVYAREQKREKEATEKAKQTATAAGEEVPTIRSNVPPQISTTTENTGPVMLGEQVPGRQFLPPITPDRQTHFTNGDVSSRAEQSNGTTVPSRVGEDVAMADSQDVEVSPTEVPPGPSVIDPNQQPSQQPSQRSAFEKVAYGSQVADYHNSASTTTSGQKSNRSSDRSHFAAAGANSNHTQSTNGVGASGGMIPDFSSVQQPLAGGSQLPDTQGENMSVHDEALFSSFGTDVSLTFDAVEYPTGSSQGAQSNSQPSQNSSQPFPVPPLPGPSRQHTAISSLLNTTEPPQFQLDEVLLGKLHDELVTRSSGLSVEQLEQVNAALMDAVWKEKTLWNRNKVIEAVMNEFNKTMEDIQAMQDVLDPSQRLLSRMGSAAAQMGGDGGVRSANGLGRAGGGTQTTGGLHSQMTGGLQSQISGAGGQGSQMVSQEH